MGDYEKFGMIRKNRSRNYEKIFRNYEIRRSGSHSYGIMKIDLVIMRSGSSSLWDQGLVIMGSGSGNYEKKIS